ncbi:MAG: Flp pilus assembly protein CpaB [Chloroflexota bacterium]|nr:Flp pilus assembly protein CpaB [Chloroflexota bacterium]
MLTGLRQRTTFRVDGRLPLVGGVALALLTGGLIYASLAQARDQVAAPLEVIPIVVPKADIEAGTSLDAANVGGLFEIVRIPTAKAPTDAVTSLAALEGRVPATPLKAGEYLTSAELTTPSATTSGPRADLLPPGHVAIVLDVTEHISVGGAVAPTDRVDMIATIMVPSASATVPVTQAILRDVRVLATGFRTRPAPAPQASAPPAPGVAAPADTGPAPYSTLTLALVPQDAVIVQHLLAQNVRLALALRRPGEQSVQTVPETTAEITQRYHLNPTDPPAVTASVPPPSSP